MAQYVIHVAPLEPGEELLITAGDDPDDWWGNGYITGGGTAGGPWLPSYFDGLLITPEPTTLSLLALGGLALLRRQR